MYFHFNSMSSSAGCLRREIYEMKDLTGYRPAVPHADNAALLAAQREREVARAKFESEMKRKESQLDEHESSSSSSSSSTSSNWKDRKTNNKTPAWLKRSK
jgi:hypothetical protein